MKRAMSSGIALSGALLLASAAGAQTAERGISVADRARPDYDPLGADLGSFRLYPSLTATVNATDNYRATDTNRLEDVYLTLAPEVRIASNWSRNRLNGRLFLDQGFHAQLPGENATEYGASANGVLDITRSSVINADVSAGHYVESRSNLSSFRNSSDPVRYEIYRASIGGAREFNRLNVNASVGASYSNFHDVRGLGGTIVDQDFRDYRTLTESASATYDVGGGIGMIISGQANQNRYSFRPGAAGFDILTNIDRQSSGYSLQGGLTFELSSLVFGSIQVGWLKRNYLDPRLNDFSGLSYNGDILWNVTPLTSLRFHAARSIEDTSSTAVAGNIRNDFSLAVDHELYRYVILSGDVRYGSFSPNGPGVGGTEYGAGASVRYLLDRNWSATLNVRYDRRDTASNFLRYHAALIGLSAKYAF